MKILLRFIKPYTGLCICTLIVMVLDAAGGLLIPSITAAMINSGISGARMEYLIQNGIYMFIAAAGASISGIAASYLSARLSANVGRDLRNSIYDASLAFSSHDFEQFGTASMITRTLNDVTIVQQGLAWFIQMVLPVPAVCILGIVLAFSIDTMMGFLLIGVTAFIILLAFCITRRASAIFSRLQQFLDTMNRILRENITGVRVIRAFNKEQHEQIRMNRSFESYAESAIKANRLFAGLESAAILSVNVCIVLILGLGANRTGAGFMQIGDITALTQYAVMILFYIIMAQMVIMLIPRALICMRRIADVLQLAPEITDGVRPPEQAHEKTDGTISFRNVSFRFADADENTLQHITFTCKKGETAAIIGSTGSGKSTIAKLILRLHDPTSGSILLNGTDIRCMTQHELRTHIAYVPQQAWLFSGSIADNLRYGNSEADETDICRALTAAQASFVFSLPDGIHSRAAQGGRNFSGGQKQRLAIARALIKQADIYIFDDSFSALDFKTDAALRKSLAREPVMQDAACLIITQRISTIRHAHQIIVLEEGKIAGIGTHEQLMRSCAVYRDIAASQMNGEQP